jgi:hypothetical protein
MEGQPSSLGAWRIYANGIEGENRAKKNSFIRGGCSDEGVQTYYEKTTAAKVKTSAFF